MSGVFHLHGTNSVRYQVCFTSWHSFTEVFEVLHKRDWDNNLKDPSMVGGIAYTEIPGVLYFKVQLG